MSGAAVRRRVVVHGLVQGVWFRDSVRRRAERHGVAGWARNLPDGTVEAVLEGAAEAVDLLVEFCRLGPPDAVVTSVDVVVEPFEGLDGFVIR
ncbi:MAG: acylphosphatase [Thermoleophilia bacterium]|nr:acylphosphatase [Thermoleophilia bacterium]MDH4345529.1 acylphosphatase [Thermoleophilia bacterium]MDH5333053.1 acylphosphatase [Thermoleophilia bacterium]